MRPALLSLAAIALLTAGAPASGSFDPGKPRNLRAVAIGPFSIELDWRNVGGAEYYEVWRDGQKIAEVEPSRYRDEGLQPATTYEYRVRAVDDDGDTGDFSDRLQVTTDPPPGPTTPEDLVASANGTNGIDLQWSASSAPSGISFYRIFRDGSEIATTGSTSFSDTGLSPATTYTYRVSAVDSNGSESAKSAPAQATTEEIPRPTTPGDLSANALGATRIALTWSASEAETGIAFYRVFRNGAAVATMSSTAYEDSGLTPLTEYEYRVSAVDNAGLESDLSEPASATTTDYPPPPPPDDLAAVPFSSSQINLTWSAPGDSETEIDGYRVYRDAELVGFVVGTAFADTGLTPDTEYGYTVSSIDERGVEGEPTAEVSATTDATQDVIPPAPPTGLRLAGS